MTDRPPEHPPSPPSESTIHNPKSTILSLPGWAQPGDAFRDLLGRVGHPWQGVALADLQAEGDALGAAGREAYTEALARRLEAAEGPVVLVGWSMGGTVALEGALARPDRVRGLILINTTACFPRPPGDPRGQPPRNISALALGVRTAPGPALFAFWRHAAQPQPPDRDMIRAQVAYAKGLGTEALLHGLDYLRETDLRSRLGAVAVPTLVLHAEEDRIIPVGAGRELAEGIPNAKLAILPELGHDAPKLTPAPLAARIREELARW